MRRVVSLILCFMLAGGISVKADDLKDAQNQLNKVQDSISNKKEELNNINKNKQKVEQDIKNLDSSMTTAEDKVNKLNASVVQINSQIAVSQKEISKAEKEIKEQTELLKARVRAMYMSGNTAFLEVVFNSKNFEDMITRVEYVKKIMDYDKSLLKNMEYKKKNLESQKSEIEKKKADALALKQKADLEVKNLQDLTNKKKDMMKSLDRDKAAFESAIAEEEAQSKNITAMIKQIEVTQEAKRKKDEEAKKQQEVNKATSSGGGGTSTNKPEPRPTPSNGKYSRILDGSYPITSPYGERIHPIFNTKINHAGIDIGVGTGTPVHALADGEIVYAGWMSGYGNVVMIDHGDLISLYAHNSSVNVSLGQQVKGGQVVSYSGSTGNSTGPHLHFEIRKSNGDTINPDTYYIR